MFASLAVFALSGIMPVSSVAGEPTWIKDYSLARQHGATANKPVLVVVGSGSRGWDKVSQQGGLSKAVQQVLAESYVCVYLDMQEQKGKALADVFEVHGRGMIISTRDASSQAFRHEGTLKNDELEWYLKRYADPFYVAKATEAPARRIQYYSGPMIGTSLTPASAPVCRT